MLKRLGLCLGMFGLVFGLVFGIQPANASGVQGLMALKHMAKSSVPYETAIANNHPTVIEFYADWCTSCQSMAPTVTQLHEQYGNEINFVMLDIDDPQWAEPVEQFGVQGVPQLTLLTADEQPVQTIVGKVPEAILQDFLNQVRT